MALVTKFIDPTETALNEDEVLLWTAILPAACNAVFVMDNEHKIEQYDDVGSALGFITECGGVVAFSDGTGIGFYTMQEE